MAKLGAFCDSPLYQQLKAMVGHVVEVRRPYWDHRIVGVLRDVMPPTTGGRPPMLDLNGHEAGYLVDVDTAVVDMDAASAIVEQDRLDEAIAGDPAPGARHAARVLRHLPELLRDTRKRRELTQDEATVQMGLTQAELSRFESGVRTPNHQRTLRILDWIGGERRG